jgi:hypothetical protein
MCAASFCRRHTLEGALALFSLPPWITIQSASPRASKTQIHIKKMIEELFAARFHYRYSASMLFYVR